MSIVRYDPFRDLRTLQEEVVRPVNGAGQAVLNGREQIVGSLLIDGRKEGLEGRTRYELNVLTEQLDRSFLTESSPFGLKSYPWFDVQRVHSFSCAGVRSTHTVPSPELQPDATHE